MAHTNSTPNYNLPQFLGTDKPAWLTDINTAMSDIDTAIAAAKSTADSASAAASALGITVGNHTTQLSTLSGAVTSQGNTLNTVTALIGNGTPTTTDQTIIGAINEINARVTAATSLGVQTVITATSQSDPYTFPNDGYLTASANSSAGQCEVVIMGSDGIPQGLRLKAVYDANAGTGLNALFVKKGMKCYRSSANGSAEYYSLT